MLESGEASSMKEIARGERVHDSYGSRMVNLTTLAPDIVAAILDETLPEGAPCSTWRRGRRYCGAEVGEV